ncbi:MAG: pre-peptidase C-terminal domain-containing protein [Elainella sp. C42_A2020_010]|nr:pre-peptidase C-terminal domain-containing protein [Elainella sp. C42_A2020_010]
MAKDPGNILKSAFRLRIGDKPRNFSNQIGGSDKRDLFRIVLERRSSLNLALTRLKANANLALLDSRGKKVIAQSRRAGRQSESIVASLTAGTYYIQVTPSSGRIKTRYRLTAFTGNTIPTLSLNTGLSLNRGSSITIGANALKVSDAEQSPNEIIYTLTSLPQIGSLQLNGVMLGVGSQFTQSDIDANRLSYTSFGLRTQITNNAVNELSEGVDGVNIIWNQGNNLGQIFNGFFDRSQITKAFFYNGSTRTTTPLKSPNTVSEIVLGISGSNAVWDGIDGSDIEVFLYNGTTGLSTQLTNNTVDDIAVGISGSNVIWNNFDQNFVFRAFFYNGTTGQVTQLLHPNSINNQAIAISGSNVLWSGFDGNDLEVFLYNGTTSIQLTNNNVDDIPEGIFGSNVIWNSTENNVNKAFFYNGSTGQVTQLTTPGSTQQAAVGISGDNVVWSAQINGTSEVFLYNALTGRSTRLTNNGVNDVPFGISDTNVVWGTEQAGVTRLFFYDGEGTVTPITDPNTRAAFGGISGSRVALTISQSDGTDPEIYFYNLKNFAPTDSFNFTVTDQQGSIEGTFQFTIS